MIETISTPKGEQRASPCEHLIHYIHQPYVLFITKIGNDAFIMSYDFLTIIMLHLGT
jgi:hypothetical protein